MVDNDPEFRHYFKTLLTKHGYYVLTAATADDAVDAARRFRPRVVIVDLALPDAPGAELGDGADLVAQLQTGTLIREIYCFMVTGYEPADVRERLALLQVTPEIWQKPLDGEKFLKRLDEILSGENDRKETTTGSKQWIISERPWAVGSRRRAALASPAIRDRRLALGRQRNSIGRRQAT